MFHLIGGACSLCGSSDGNKRTCPLNKESVNPQPNRHPNAMGKISPQQIKPQSPKQQIKPQYVERPEILKPQQIKPQSPKQQILKPQYVERPKILKPTQIKPPSPKPILKPQYVERPIPKPQYVERPKSQYVEKINSPELAVKPQSPQRSLKSKSPYQSPSATLKYSKINGLSETFNVLINIRDTISRLNYNGGDLPPKHPINRFINLFLFVISGDLDGIADPGVLESVIFRSEYKIGFFHLKKKREDHYQDFIPSFYYIMTVINKLNDTLNNPTYNKIINGIFLGSTSLCLNALTTQLETDIDDKGGKKKLTFEEYLSQNCAMFARIVCMMFSPKNSKKLAHHLLHDYPTYEAAFEYMYESEGLTKEQAVKIAEDVFDNVLMFESCDEKF